MIESALAGRPPALPSDRDDLARVHLGVLPLVLAGRGLRRSQRAIGTGVMGGALVGTFLAVFFVPMFFVNAASSGQRTAAATIRRSTRRPQESMPMTQVPLPAAPVITSLLLVRPARCQPMSDRRRSPPPTSLGWPKFSDATA